MKKADVDFLKGLFLSDPETGKSARIIKVEGAESAHDHLRVYTQSVEQKKNGIAMLHKIYAEEVDAVEQGLPTVVAKCPPDKHNFMNGFYCSVCGEAQF